MKRLSQDQVRVLDNDSRRMGDAAGFLLDPKGAMQTTGALVAVGTATVTEGTVRVVGTAGGVVAGAAVGLGKGLVSGVRAAFIPCEERKAQLAELKAMQQARRDQEQAHRENGREVETEVTFGRPQQVPA